jgi:hypothetical protein
MKMPRIETSKAVKTMPSPLVAIRFRVHIKER